MKKNPHVFIMCMVMFFIGGCSQKYIGPNLLIVEKFDLQEDSLLLVVKVKSTELTDFHPACEGCVPWSFWYVHEAKVIDVISGDFESEKIKFAMLQHADYIKEIKNEWYIHLKTVKNSENINLLGTEYYLVDHGSEFSLKSWQ